MAGTAVERLLALATALARIAVAMLFTPHRLDEKINAGQGVQRSVPMYSFLTVCIFSAVKACKYLLMLFILANLVWLRGCDPATQQPINTPEVAQHLNIPGVQDILLIGLPSALLVLGLLAALRAVLRRVLAADIARRFYNVAVYVAGFEYLMLALALAGSLPFITRSNRWRMLEMVPLVSLLAAVVWGALLLTLTIMRVSRVPGRRRSWYAALPASTGAFLLMLVWNAAIVGALPLLAIPLASNAIQPELEKPAVTMALLHQSLEQDGTRRLSVALTNLGAEHRYLLHEDLVVLIDDLTRAQTGCKEGQIFSGSVLEWRDDPVAGTMLAPKEVLQLTIDLQKRQVQECDLDIWQVPQSDDGLLDRLSLGLLNYPVPPHYLARVSFKAVNVQSGVKGKLVAFLLAEPGFETADKPLGASAN